MGSITKSPPPAALHTFLTAHPAPPHVLSQDHHHTLALQIAHNLRYQHAWTDVRIHYPSNPPSISTTSSSSEKQRRQTSHRRPLLSGLPPRRLYIHPDEQIALLQAQKDAEREGKAAGNGSVRGVEGATTPAPEREWVLPTHIREKWSPRGFGEVFDGIARVPSSSLVTSGEKGQWGDGEALFADKEGRGGGGGGSSSSETVKVPERQGEAGGNGIDTENAWRTTHPKRLVLATLEDDSPVVYYLVHDGIVKPRQN